MATTPIYLDHTATTPVDPHIIDVLTRALHELPGNASSIDHVYGWQASQAVQHAREQLADLIGGDPKGVVWTSGATESNNLAIKGCIEHYCRQGKHLITSAIEHASVLQCFQYFSHQGYEVTYLKPDTQGLVHAEQVAQALREDTILVSIMHANNEVGTVQPITEIAEVLQDRGVVFHVDAAQSLGKIPVDIRAMGVDLLSVSAHKCYGPKGVGALYVRQQPRIRLQAQVLGGRQEQGMRSGTLATHQLVGMGESCTIAQSVMVEEAKRLQAWRDMVWDALESMPGVTVNGSRKHHLPGHLHFTVMGKDNAMLINAMPELALSRGSACQQEAAEPSHVLRAMGLSAQQAQSSLRLAFGRFTTEDDVALTLHVLERACS